MSVKNSPIQKTLRRLMRAEKKANPYVAPPSFILNHDQRRAFRAAMRRAEKDENLSDRTDPLVRRYIEVGKRGLLEAVS